MRIERIFISKAHNYVGRHGEPPMSNPAIELTLARCVSGMGIVDDRFFGHKEGYKGQVTFFSLEVFLELQRELGLPAASPCALRRNVVVSGIDLAALIGMRFSISGVVFEGVEECKPCYWMDRALAPGAEIFLKGRGGLRARVLSDGSLYSDRGAEAEFVVLEQGTSAARA